MTSAIARRPAARALAALSLIGASGAYAQKSALVQDVDASVRVPYQAAQSATNCNSAGNCALVFPAVPAGHRRAIEQISCNVLLSSGTLNGPVMLSSQTFRDARIDLPAATTPAAVPNDVANTGTLVFYEAGEMPRLDAYANGSYLQFSCTLVGRDVVLP